MTVHVHLDTIHVHLNKFSLNIFDEDTHLVIDVWEKDFEGSEPLSTFEYSPCAYCGGNCPYEPDDSGFLCDGFAGDIDGLYKEDECRYKIFGYD